MIKLEGSGGVWITSGDSYDDTTIAAEIGAPGSKTMDNGSIYISTNTTTPGIWIAVAGTWTQLTIN